MTIKAWLFNYSMTFLSKNHIHLLSSGLVFVKKKQKMKRKCCITPLYGFSQCCCVAGFGFSVSAALWWKNVKLPDRPSTTLWRRLVFPLYVSPPVGQWGTLLGAKEPGGVWSDAHVSPLPSGDGFWRTALAWGWHRLSTFKDINRDSENSPDRLDYKKAFVYSSLCTGQVSPVRRPQKLKINGATCADRFSKNIYVRYFTTVFKTCFSFFTNTF